MLKLVSWLEGGDDPIDERRDLSGVFGKVSSGDRNTRWETTSVLPAPAAAMIWMCEPRWATASAAAPSSTGIW